MSVTEKDFAYERVIVEINGKLKTLTHLQFSKFWRKVGHKEGTKAFRYRSYDSKLLDPFRKDCPHIITNLMETFGHESNIIICVKCRCCFREETGEFGITLFAEYRGQEPWILYKGKRFEQWKKLQENFINVQQ